MPIDLDIDIPQEWIQDGIVPLPPQEEYKFPICSTEKVCEKKEKWLDMSKEQLEEGVDYLDTPHYTRAQVFDYVDDCQEKFEDLRKEMDIVKGIIRGQLSIHFYSSLIGELVNKTEKLYESLYLSDIGFDYDNKK